MAQTDTRILLCDDDSVFRKRLARSLRDKGCRVYEADNARTGLEVFVEYRPEKVLVDLRMPGESGLWLVTEVLACDPTCKVVVLTGFGSIATALDAIKRGAVHYLTKPTSVAQIIAAFSPESSETAAVQAAAQTQLPSLAEVEAEYVQRVLDECGGNVSQSAKILGVHRRSLQRKLSKTYPS